MRRGGGTSVRLAAACTALGALLAPGRPARAADSAPVVVWPTLTPAGDAPGHVALHRPTEAEPSVLGRAQELDATLRDAVQDLGLTLQVADSGPAPSRTRDLDLLERAHKGGEHDGAVVGAWVISPRLEADGSGLFIVRILAVPPRGQEIRLRVERVRGSDVSARGLVMLRELLSTTSAARAAAQERDRAQVDTSATLGITAPLRSPGRAPLAFNATLFGAYTAFSIQHASGSDDPRVLYPLLALGSGIGLGSALLASAEWDVSSGDAWFIAAGGWWGAASGVLFANGSRVQPLSDRYAWGVGGGLLGIGLATAALVRNRVDEGDAALAHSGAALGLLIGSAGELLYLGTLDATPDTGAAYGTAIGLISAGALATVVRVSPSRVFLTDVGVGLGALAGAAAASPLLLDNVSETKTRAFLGATLAGSLLGGGITWFFARDMDLPKTGSWRVAPIGGVIGSSATPRGPAPAFGAGIRGEL